MNKLERAADAPPGNVVVGKPGEVLVLQPDPARVWLPLAGDNIEQGRLAGAVWTDYRANLTFTNIEADAIDRQQAAEPLRQLLNPKHRLSHFPLPSALTARYPPQASVAVLTPPLRPDTPRRPAGAPAVPRLCRAARTARHPASAIRTPRLDCG